MDARAGCRKTRCGFTLIELMTTMTVILIISGFVVASIGGNDGGNELDSGISRADSVFALARSAAISRKTPVRVLVCNDSTRPDEWLRYMTIYYLDDADSQWKPFTEGEVLPPRIFVDLARMQRGGGEYRTWNANGVTSQQIIENYSEIAEPSADNLPLLPVNGGAGANQWIVYEFHPNGTARHPMSRFIVGRSIQPSANLNVVPNGSMRAGFVLFRSGKVVHFQSSEHLLGET